MRTGRWISAAIAALAIAILPGALQLVPQTSGVHRARPNALGSVDAREPAAASEVALAPPTTAAPAPPPPPSRRGGDHPARPAHR